MSFPPWLLAAAIALWGWQTGDWIPAVIAAMITLSPRVITRRWDIGNEQLTRVADFCTALALAAGAIGGTIGAVLIQHPMEIIKASMASSSEVGT